MFEAKINDPKLLKNGIAAVYELIKEDTAIQLTNDGIMITAMDPAQVSMVVFRLLTPAFESYKLSKEGIIGIDMERLNQVLKQVNPDDSLTLKVDENTFKLTARSRSTRTFSIPLMEISEDAKKPPTLEFTSSVVVSGDVLAQAFDDAAVVADSLVMLTEDNKLNIIAAGDLGKVEVTLEAGDDALKEIRVKERTKSRYAIDYLQKIIKGAKLANDVQLNLRSDYPLQVDFSLQDLARLSFILAPRVESE